MLDAANEIIEFSKGKNREDLDSDRKLNLSLVHLLEIIGEAAVGITKGFREQFPEVPWKVIVGMRNRLIHGYYDIDLDIVWKTVIEEIPSLLAELEKIIKKEKVN
jgi:uncharacterized protein with HEPN domain